MQSIFRYPGGKTRAKVQKWILSHRPTGVQEYREPFVGGGGIFFGAGYFERRWINDINPGLIAVYQALAERPNDFIAACRSISPAQDGEEQTAGGERGGLPVNKRLKDVFDSLAFNEEADPALRYFFVNRTVFAGRVNYSIPSRLYFSNPDGWNIVSNGQLEEAAQWVKGTKITCGDYERLFSEPGEGVWIYADPPYAVNSELSRTSQLYEHNFTDADHRRLADVVRACEHKVAISYDYHPDILRLYPESDGFFHYRNRWTYCGTTNDEKETGEELLICNYEADPLFAGDWGLVPTTLDEDEQRELDEREARITAALRSFMVIGEELFQISSRKLYKAYGNFANYCHAKWGLGKVYPYFLMKAYHLTDAIQKFTIVNFLPQSESVCRPLLRLASFKKENGVLSLTDAERAVKVWDIVATEATNTEKPVTAKQVKEAVDAELGIEPKEPPTPLERIKALLPKLTPQERKELEQCLSPGAETIASTS